jgi:hypothetical protein
MPALLTFSGAMAQDPAIDRWFATRPSELASIARDWFEVMRSCGANVRELMHDGCLNVCVQDAPFAYVNAFTSHVNVGFFHGASLADPEGLLEGAGKYMRHVKLKPGRTIDASALKALINASYQDILMRLEAVE